MTTERLRTPDPRGLVRRALLLVSATVLTLLGLAVTAFGLIGVGAGVGRALLCVGLVMLVAGVGGFAREVAERAHDRHPPRPRLETAPSGEPSLFLPRSRLRSQVSSGVLAAFAGVTLLGAVFATIEAAWVWAVVLAAMALLMVGVARPGRAGAQAGGLWAGPDHLAHEHDGVQWWVSWEQVAGAPDHEPMPVLLHPGARPHLVRNAAAGRLRVRARSQDMLIVETRFLAGGSTLASYVISKALADPEFRRALGTPASLPPAESA